MGFSDALAQMFGYGPSQQAAQSVNVARAGQAKGLQDQYNSATADPNSGIGLSPAMQQMQEQELGNHVRAQMSDEGAGGSGANNDAVQKAIVDYRIAQMGKHMSYLDQLRQGMLTASQPQVQQPTVPQQAATYAMGRGMQGGMNALFGQAPNPNGNNGDSNGRPGDPSHGTGPMGPNGTTQAGQPPSSGYGT